MKKLVVGTLIALMAGGALAAGVGVQGTYWNSRNVESALGVGVKGHWYLHPAIAMEGRLGYFPSFETDIEAGGDKGVELTMIPMELGVMLNPPQWEFLLMPYAGAGVGYYYLDVESSGSGNSFAESPTVESVFGAYVLGGLEFWLTESLSVYAEFQHRTLSFDVDIGDDVTVDADQCVNVGAVLRW